MKLNRKVVDLINEGFKSKELLGFNETQINQLHERMVGKKENKEGVTTQIQQTKVTTATPDTAKKEAIPVKDGYASIDPKTGGLVVKMPLNQGKKEKKEKVIKEKEVEEIDVNITDDPDATADGMGIFEKELEESQNKINPWAICTKQLGDKFGTTERHLWTAKQKNKYESCVKQIKKENKGKIEENLFIEQKILNLVQKYVEPKMTKKDLISLVERKQSNSPATKPKEAPTKPDKTTSPKEKPFDPYKPKPTPNPNPKASGETKESNAPATKPKEAPTKPGTKTPPKEKPFDPFKPKPTPNPNPKAKVPNWLSFKKLGIKFKK